MADKPLKTEKAIIAKFEQLREERDDIANSLGARSADLQASAFRVLEMTSDHISPS